MYGLESQLLNMHSLVHLADDVRKMGCSLSHITAFPFEDKLGKIKKCLHSAHKPLKQLCRKMEHDTVKNKSMPSKYLDFVLTTKCPNNAVIFKSGCIIKIKKMRSFSKITNNARCIEIIGEKVTIVGDAVDYPTESSLLNMFEIEESNKSKTITFLLQEIKCKAVILEIFELCTDKKKVYAVPMLH